MFSLNRKDIFIIAHHKHKLVIDNSSIIETGLMISDGEREMEKLINNHYQTTCFQREVILKMFFYWPVDCFNSIAPANIVNVHWLTD